jgi:hypothetical protein
MQLLSTVHAENRSVGVAPKSDLSWLHAALILLIAAKNFESLPVLTLSSCFWFCLKH